MDARRFDRLTRQLSRRGALGVLAGLVLHRAAPVDAATIECGGRTYYGWTGLCRHAADCNPGCECSAGYHIFRIDWREPKNPRKNTRYQRKLRHFRRTRKGWHSCLPIPTEPIPMP